MSTATTSVDRLQLVPDDSPYQNRELSWLHFNARVLEEAMDPRNPLLERLRFLTIFHTNLDEFYMIRVSGLRQQVLSGVAVLSNDGLSARMQLQRITELARPAFERAGRCLQEDILPALALSGVRLVHYKDLSEPERKAWDAHYLAKVHPILTPLAVGPTHPFPFLSNLSLNLGLFVTSPSGERRFARVKVPRDGLARLQVLDPNARPDRGGGVLLMPLEELIAANLQHLFPGMKLERPWVFRVIRDADIDIRIDEADDLLTELQERLRRRRFGQVVQARVQQGMPGEMREILKENLILSDADIHDVRGHLDAAGFAQLLSFDLPALKFKPFLARPLPPEHRDDLWATLRHGDLLLHHPFDSFGNVVDFVRAAANDPHVVAIKQTLYRTNADSPIIEALEDAVDAGKQVAVVVELKARFDEENNIVWARRLEEAGVHVIYGVPGLKVHCKACLVVRSEGGELRGYAHLSTGNYNSNSARVYTDLGILTANPAITQDVAEVFNELTGFSVPNQHEKVLMAPRFLKRGLLDLIDFETHEARHGRAARIIAKCNAVTDPEIIRALYTASQAGVQIDLVVRGICSLVPGVPGWSENIRVKSVVGRFLEHSRCYWFQAGGSAKVYIGSADWMDRNLTRRVELLVPVESKPLKRWLRHVLLERYLRDTRSTRWMTADRDYVRAEADGDDAFDVHEAFLMMSDAP